VTERSGIFITLEGGDGVGKSTAAARLAEAMQASGHEVVLTREPGGTPGAEAVRTLLLGSKTHFDPLAQTMLHFAARADHVARVIRPALTRGAVVICDRFYDSTMAYQAYGMGVDITVVASLVRLIDLQPDITFMLEVPDSVSKTRRATRGAAADRYEAMGQDVRARIAHGFRAIATSEPDRCIMIDGAQAPDSVVRDMRRLIQERTGR
jgi:dTMP kinase